MTIRLLTITHKMPAWIKEGYQEYSKRLTPPFNLELIEIPAEKRGPNADLKRLIERESEKMLSLIKPGSFVIALDSKGLQWNTEQLSEKLSLWSQAASTIDLLVGGPEGHSQAILQRANEKWSLSLLTFPHHLVRIIIAEQLYRAVSILKNHPYHRRRPGESRDPE